MRMTGERLFNLFLFGLIVFFVVGAFDFSTKARSAPLIAGIPALILMVIPIIKDYLPKKERITKKEDNQEEELNHTMDRRLWTMLGALAILPLLILVFGLSIGIALFLFLFLLIVSRQKWWIASLIGVCGFSIAYFFFGQILNYRLYQGLLGVL